LDETPAETEDTLRREKDLLFATMDDMGFSDEEKTLTREIMEFVASGEYDGRSYVQILVRKVPQTSLYTTYDNMHLKETVLVRS